MTSEHSLSPGSSLSTGMSTMVRASSISLRMTPGEPGTRPFPETLCWEPWGQGLDLWSWLVVHSVLYFSWHRYEHGHFWPYLRESDADAVGQGQGRGFTVNLPWNQVPASPASRLHRAPHPGLAPAPQPQAS